MSGEKAAELAARLDRLPASRALWTIVLLISLGGVFEFYDLFFTAYVSRGIRRNSIPHGSARAVGFVYSWSRLAAAFARLIVGFLLATAGVTAVALFIAGAMLVGIGTISLLGPETNGVALERLNESVAE